MAITSLIRCQMATLSPAVVVAGRVCVRDKITKLQHEIMLER